jgi:hypothetical protein
MFHKDHHQDHNHSIHDYYQDLLSIEFDNKWELKYKKNN